MPAAAYNMCLPLAMSAVFLEIALVGTDVVIVLVAISAVLSQMAAIRVDVALVGSGIM